MENLKLLSDHCIGTAELEKKFLNEAFVNDEKAEGIIQKSINAPVLLVGKKGSGKSAIFLRIKRLTEDAGLESLFIKPDEIILKGIKGDSISIGDVKREAYAALLFAIAAQMGTQFDGLLSSEQKFFRDRAIENGLKDRDSIEKLAKMLSVIGNKFAEIDLSKLLPSQKGAHYKEVQRKIQSQLSPENKIFLLLFDDTDQIVPSYLAKDLSKIWGFLLGIRKISEEISNIKCIVSLRTEVWRALSNSRGQRDMVDHFRPLKYDLDVDLPPMFDPNLS